MSGFPIEVGSRWLWIYWKASVTHFPKKVPTPTGPGRRDGKTGFLRIKQHTPSGTVFTPQVLEDDTAYGTLVLRDRRYWIRQVVSHDRILNVREVSAHEFRIEVYSRDPKAEAGKDGFYPVEGERFRTFTIRNPEPGTNQLRFEEQFPGRTETAEYSWSDDFQHWTLVKGEGEGKQIESVSEIHDEDAGTFTRTRIHGDPKKPGETTREMLVYRDFPFGRKIIRQETGPEDEPQVKTWDYHTVPAERHRYGQVSRVATP